MKLGVLTSIAHNIADSLASGAGLMVGVYDVDLFGEVGRSPGGWIEIDFLAGDITGAEPSAALVRAVRAYSDALPGLCERHGAQVDAFRRLTVRFSGAGALAGFVTTVEDHDGRRSIDEYRGVPGRRLKVLDALGRIRPKQPIIPPGSSPPPRRP